MKNLSRQIHIHKPPSTFHCSKLHFHLKLAAKDSFFISILIFIRDTFDEKYLNLAETLWELFLTDFLLRKFEEYFVIVLNENSEIVLKENSEIVLKENSEII
jgi:hypothetical protein